MKKQKDITVESNGKVVVTDTEMNLVGFLSNGHTVEDAATGLEMNIRSAEELLKKLRFQFHCVNTTHLVATFLRKKIIE